MLKELIYPSTFAALTGYGNSITVGRQLEDIRREIGSLKLELDVKLDDLIKQTDDLKREMDGMAKRLDF